MLKEEKKIVKFNDLGLRAKMNCVLQFVYIMCPYDEFSATESWRKHFDDIRDDIDLFVEATPDQFWFDENGDWYDEGRKVR